jgi:hypothetical protein
MTSSEAATLLTVECAASLESLEGLEGGESVPVTTFASPADGYSSAWSSHSLGPDQSALPPPTEPLPPQHQVRPGAKRLPVCVGVTGDRGVQWQMEAMPRAVQHWDTSQVAAWLASVGLDEFALLLAQHEVTGEDLLDLCNDDLKSIGLESLHQRKRLLRATRALAESHGSHPC